MGDWPYPLSLTMIRMHFCSKIAFSSFEHSSLWTTIFGTKEVYMSSIVCIGAPHALGLWLSNSAYIYLFVSFIQTLHALIPVAVYSNGVLVSKETFESNNMLSVVLFEPTRLVLLQILLRSKGIQLLTSLQPSTM
ncbi:hypothetical protein L7F22_062501 [Adiantum nelumboides]|nr:hypothetical protein [Adiantum nelumboides]